MITDYFVYLLNTSFFEVVRYANIDKSYKIKDLNGLSTMDEFKEKIINDIVESKKIHAILKILVDYNPDLFVINGSDIKDEIFEIIGRRNIHVHKKGIVDEGYLRQSNGNPYGFSTGDYSAIDSIYFVTAQQPPHQTQRKPSANAEGLIIHDSYSSVDDAGLVLVAMDSLISSLQGMKLSSSSFENGLPLYCISVRMRLR